MNAPAAAANSLPAVDSWRRPAMLCMVLSSVIISFGGLIIRSMETALPWQINFHRSVALFGVVSVYLALRFGKRAPAAVRDIGAQGFIAGLMLGAAGMFFLQALTHTTVANTMFILGAIPFFAALLARIFLKEKLNRATLVTMCAAATGLGVMVFEGVTIGSAKGNALALLTALLFALYAVILRGNRHREMLPTLLISAVAIVIVSALMQGGAVRVSMHDLALSYLWGGAIAGAGHYLYIAASRHLLAAEITLFMLLEFALSPVWVWWAVGEQPSAWTLIGGVLIMAAVAARATVELLRGPRPGRFRGTPPV